MEDDLERAVEIALRLDSDTNVQQQAMSFCNQLKTSKDGWQTCLNVFTQSKRRTDNSRFYALQVLEENLRSRSFELGEANMDYMRQVLTKVSIARMMQTLHSCGTSWQAFIRYSLSTYTHPYGSLSSMT